MTEIPAGMVSIDGKLVKKAELSRQQKLENLLMFNLMTFSYIFMCAAWYVRLCWLQWQKRKSLPQRPVTLVVFGSNSESAIDLLKSYGVYACPAIINWAIHWNKVSLMFSVLVSLSQWEFADNILYQHSSDDFQVITNPGAKRGQTLPRPYSQRQAAARPPAQPTKAPLGKRYR